MYIYRCYTDPARRELDRLKNTLLVDEEERSLRSQQSYRDALQHMVDVVPPLQEYMQHNVLVTTGDWPTWYFQKKIIAQVVRTAKK